MGANTNYILFTLLWAQLVLSCSPQKDGGGSDTNFSQGLTNPPNSLDHPETTNSLSPAQIQALIEQVMGERDVFTPPSVDLKPSACRQVEALQKQIGTEKFVLLEQVRAPSRKSQPWSGLLAIDKNPYLQQQFGELLDFQFVSDEEFEARVRQECQQNLLPQETCAMLKGAFLLGLHKRAQRSQMVTAIESKFPGVLTDRPQSIEKSWPFITLSKVVDLEKISPADTSSIAAILQTVLPLFVQNSTWDGFLFETQQSLAAAQEGLNQSRASNERACALLLAHRHFAQLLALRGYLRPEMVASSGDAKRTVLKRLSEDYKEFKKIERAGAFIEVSSNTPTVLALDKGFSFEEGQGSFGLLKALPGQSSRATDPLRAGLGEKLSFMNAMVKSEDFLFGELGNLKSSAIIPEGAHSLSLGFLLLNFKSISTNHLVPVDGRGKLTSLNSAVSMALASEPRAQGALDDTIRVKLVDVVKMSRLVAGWSASLRKSAQSSPALLHQLEGLRKPLTKLLVEMTLGKASCVSEITWDLNTGQKAPRGLCREGELMDAKSALRELVDQSNINKK